MVPVWQNKSRQIVAYNLLPGHNLIRYSLSSTYFGKIGMTNSIARLKLCRSSVGHPVSHHGQF